MRMQPEEREDPAAHDQGWDLARQLAAVSASVDSLCRRAERRVTESELKKETLAPSVPPLLVERLRSLLHSDGLLPPLSESAGDAGGSQSRAQASQKERSLEKFVAGYCSLSPLCSEVLTLLQLLLFKETGASFRSEDRKQKGAPGQADGDSRLEKKLQRDLEELSELLLSFLCSIFEQDSLDTADFRTWHTRRKVSAAVTAQAFLSSLGLFLSSSPSTSSSLLPPSPLLRLRCLQLLRAAVAVPHSPAAFSVAAALGAHASSGAETESGDRLLFAGLVVALEGPQSKLRQTKKQPGNSRGGGLWPPPLACNAAPEETLPVSPHKVRCGRRNVSSISRLLTPEAGRCRHHTDSALGPEASRALSPTEVAAAVRRLTRETVGSGEETPGRMCEAVPIRYALRQEALCLLLNLLLHRDKSVGLALLQRPPPRVQAVPSPLSGSPSSASSPAAQRPASAVDLLIKAFLPLRFDRRQDALVWLLGFRRALLDLETRARLSAAFRASAGGRRGGRERSHFSEVFNKGEKGGPGEEDSFRAAVEETGSRGERPSGPGGANPVGWVWRRLATGPVLHAFAHLLHAFTSRESLEQLLGPLGRQMEETARHAEVDEDDACTGSQGGEVPQRTEGSSEGIHSLGALECGSDVHASGQGTGMPLGADIGFDVGLLPSLCLSSDASCSSPSWLLQSLLRDFIFSAFPTSAPSSAPSASSPRPAHSPPSSAQASLVLSFLHALRPVFLPPQQELLLSLLAAYPLELQTRFLETFSALHLAARSSVQFALSHFLLFRLLMLPLKRLRASPAILDSLLPPLPPSSPIFSPPPDGASCLATAAETRRAAETLEAAAKVQLQEMAVAEKRRQVIQPLLSLMSPPGLQLRQHLTASLLHSSLSVNFFGFVLLRVACRLFQTVGEALVQATQVHEAEWGGDGRGALSRLLKAAMRERLPDEKTVLNCLKKLEQRFRVFQEEATSTKKRKKKVRVVWDVDAWDANARWPTDEALVKEQVDKDLKGRRSRKHEGGDTQGSASTRHTTEKGKQKAKGEEEDEDLDLHLGGLDDASDEDRDTIEESDTEETQGDETSSPGGRDDAGGSRKADVVTSLSLTPAFVLNLSLSLLHSLSPRRGLPWSGEGRSDAVGLLGWPSASSPSCLAPRAAGGTEETDARVQTNGGTTPLALLLSCLDVAHLYQTLLLPPGGFSLDWSRLLVAPSRSLASPFERDQGGSGSASLTGVPSPSVWALEPKAGAAVVALGLQALGGGDGLEGLRFGFLAGSTMSKQTMIFLTQLLFQWRLSVLKEESEQLALEHSPGSKPRSLRESSLSEELLGLFFRCLSLSPLFETDIINELAVWVAALAPLAPRQPKAASSDCNFCFRCAASYFLAIVKFAIEKPLLLLSQKTPAFSPVGPHRVEETAGATPGVSLFVRALLAHLSLAPECNRGKPLYVDVSGPSLSLFLSPDALSLSHADSCPAAAPSTAKKDTAFCVDSIGAWVSRGLLALLALRPCLLEPVRRLLDRQKPWRVVGAALGAGKDGADKGDEPPGEEKHKQKQSKKRTREESVEREEKGESKEAADRLGDAETERERGGGSAEKENAIVALRNAASRHPLYPRMNDWRRRLSRVLREASWLARQEQEPVEQYGVLDLQGSQGCALAESGDGERDIVLEEASRFLPSERLLLALGDLDASLGFGTSEAESGIQIDGAGGAETALSSASTGPTLEFVLRQIHPSRALVGVSPGDSERRKNGLFRRDLESLPASAHARSCPRSPLQPPVARPLALAPDAAAAARSNVGCLLGLWASCLRHQTIRLSLAPAETERETPTGECVASTLEKLLETFHLIQRLSERAAPTSFPVCLSKGMQPCPVASRALQERGALSRVCAPCGTSDGDCGNLGLPDADASWISAEPGLNFSSPLARASPAEICDCSVFACLLNSAGSQGINGRSLERLAERKLRESALGAETRRAVSAEEDASGEKDREHLRAARKKKRETGDKAKGEEGETTVLRIALLSCTYITTVLIEAAAGACRRENSGWGQQWFLPPQKRDSSGFLAVARRLIPLLLTQVAIPLSRLAALEQRRQLLGSRLARESSGPGRRQTGEECDPDSRVSPSALQVHARETLERICAAAAVWGVEQETVLAPAVCFLHGASAQDFTAGARKEASKKRGGRGVCSRQEEDETEQESRLESKGERRRGSGAIYASGPGARFPASLEGRWPLDLVEMYMETFGYGKTSVGSLQPFREMYTEEKSLSSSLFSPSSLSRPLDTAEIRLLLVLLQRGSEPGGASKSEEKNCGLPRAVTDSCTDTREELQHRARIAKLLVRLLDALRKSRFRGTGGSLPAVETPELDEGQKEEAKDEIKNSGEKLRRATLRTFDTLQVVYERQLVQQCLMPVCWLLPASSLSSSLSAASDCGVCTPETEDPRLWRVIHPGLSRLFHHRFAESPFFRVAVGLELGSRSFAALSDVTASPVLSPSFLLSHAEAAVVRNQEGGGRRGCLLPAWRFALELLQLTENTRCLPPLFPARRRLIKRLLACTGLTGKGEAGFKKAKKEEEDQQTGPGDDAKREKKIKQAATNWGESMLRIVLRACDRSPSQGVEAFDKSSSLDVGSPESDAEPRFSPATERKLLNAALDFYEGREGDYGVERPDRFFADTLEATEISPWAFSSPSRGRRQSEESEEADGEETAEDSEGQKTREARSDVSEDTNETFALLQRAVSAIQKGLTSFANRSSISLHEQFFLDVETPQGCGRFAALEDGGRKQGEDEEEARRTRVALQRSAALWMAVGLYEASRRCSQEAGTCRDEGGTSGDSTGETSSEKRTAKKDASSSRACFGSFLVDAFAGICCRLAVEVFSVEHAEETVARSLLSPTRSRWRSTPVSPLADGSLSAALSAAAAHLLERLENLQELLVHEWPAGTESGNQATASRHRLGEKTELPVVDFLAQLQLAVSLWQLLRRLPVSECAAKSSRDAPSSSLSSCLPSSVSASPFSAALRRKADRCMLRLARSFCRRPGGTRKLDEVATLLASASGSDVSRQAGEEECLHPKKLLASSRSRAALYARAWCLTYLPVWRAGLVAAAALPAKASEARTDEKEETAEGDEQTLRRKRVWTLAEEMLHSDALWQLAAGLRFLCLAACKNGVRQELKGVEERSRGTVGRKGEERDALKEDKQEGPGAKGEGGGGDEFDSGQGWQGRDASLEASGDALQTALLPLIHCLGQELLPTYYAASSEKQRKAEREHTDGTSGEENLGEWAEFNDADGDYGYDDVADEYENNSRRGYGKSGKSIFFDDEEEEAREAGHRKREAAGLADETSTERHLSLLIDILPKELYALFASLYGASASFADLCLRDIFTADRAEVREVYIHSSFAFTAQRAGEGLASDAGSLAGLLPVTASLAWMARLPEPRERHRHGELNRREGDDEGEDALLLLLSFLRHAEERLGFDGEDERVPKRRKAWKRKETKDSLLHAWTLDSFQAFLTECEEAAPSSSLTSVLVAALGTQQSTSLDWLGLNPNRMQKTLDAFPFSASLQRPLDSGLEFAVRGNDVWGRPGDSGGQADRLGGAQIAARQTTRATSLGVCTLPATPLDVPGSSGGCTYTTDPAARDTRWGQDALFRFLSRTQTESEAIHPLTCRPCFALATWLGDTAFSSFAPPPCDEDERAKSKARLETVGVSTTGYDIAYLVPFLTGRLVAACTVLLYQMRDPREVEARGTANGDGLVDVEPAEVAALQQGRDSTLPCLAVLARRACATAHRWLQSQREKTELQQTGASERRRRRRRRRLADAEEDDGELGYAEEEEEGAGASVSASPEEETDSWLLAAFDLEELDHATDRVWTFLNAARQLQTRQRMRRDQITRLKAADEENLDGGEVDPEEVDGDDGRWLAVEELEHEDQAEAALAQWAEERQQIDQQGAWLRKFASGGGLQILFMALSATDEDLRSAAFHGLAVFSHLLRLSADLTLLHTFAEKHFLLSKIATLSTSLAAAAGEGAGSAPGGEGSTNLQKSSLLSAKKRKFVRQLEQHKSVFAFRELRQVQLLLAAVCSSVEPPTSAERAETGDTRVEEETSVGMAKAKRRRRRAELDDEEDEAQEEVEGWTETESRSSKQERATGNDAALCPAALHPILTAFAASAVPFLLQPEHPLFSLLNDFLLQRSSLSSLLFSRGDSPFLYLPARAASSSSSAHHAPGLGRVFSSFLFSPVSVSSLQQKQFVLTCLLRALAASACPAWPPGLPAGCTRRADSETVSLLLPPPSVFLYASSPALSFASVSSPFLPGVFAALRLAVQLPQGFLSQLVCPGPTGPTALPIACWNACALLQRHTLIPWLLHHMRLLLFPPVSPFSLSTSSSVTSSLSSSVSSLASSSPWTAFLDACLAQTQPLPRLAAGLLSLSLAECLEANTESPDSVLRTFARQRREALPVARDTLAFLASLLDASLLAPPLPSRFAAARQAAASSTRAVWGSQETAEETDAEKRRISFGERDVFLEPFDTAWRREVLSRLLRLFARTEGVDTTGDSFLGEKTSKSLEPTKEVTKASLAGGQREKASDGGVAPPRLFATVSAPEHHGDVLLLPQVAAWPVCMGLSFPLPSSSSCGASALASSPLGVQVTLLRSRLLGLRPPSPLSPSVPSLALGSSPRLPAGGNEAQVSPVRVQASAEGITLLASIFDFLRCLVRLWVAWTVSGPCLASLRAAASSASSSVGCETPGGRRAADAKFCAESRDAFEADEARTAARSLFGLCWKLCWCACSLFQPAPSFSSSPLSGVRDDLPETHAAGGASSVSKKQKKRSREESVGLEATETDRGGRETQGLLRPLLSPLQRARLEHLRQAASACVEDLLTLCEAAALSAASRPRKEEETGIHLKDREGTEPRTLPVLAKQIKGGNAGAREDDSTLTKRVIEMLAEDETSMQSEGDTCRGGEMKKESPCFSVRRQTLAKREELLMQWLHIWCLLKTQGETASSGLVCGVSHADVSCRSPSRLVRYIKCMSSETWLA
ncbi:hypothetical protein TGARI_213300 [Toxoplasma gondii ARI]|uniref:Uncharacterized protein n=1 Tax=Toxoplasma gondii ARI TaxID=1074872 RepID=A0A139XXY7_TOXGO|nr:hypothetical protein TGARI_213300 [Toxoplasma gondii ARI]